MIPILVTVALTGRFLTLHAAMVIIVRGLVEVVGNCPMPCLSIMKVAPPIYQVLVGHEKLTLKEKIELHILS